MSQIISQTRWQIWFDEGGYLKGSKPLVEVTCRPLEDGSYSWRTYVRGSEFNVTRSLRKPTTKSLVAYLQALIVETTDSQIVEAVQEYLQVLQAQSA